MSNPDRNRIDSRCTEPFSVAMFLNPRAVSIYPVFSVVECHVCLAPRLFDFTEECVSIPPQILAVVSNLRAIDAARSRDGSPHHLFRSHPVSRVNHLSDSVWFIEHVGRVFDRCRPKQVACQPPNSVVSLDYLLA